MRPIWLGLAGATFALSAWAQNAPIQSSPLPPLQQQWQREGSPPVPQAPTAPQTPASPGAAAPNVQGQGQAPPAGSPATPPGGPSATPPSVTERPNVWVPASAVKLEALDKVDAQATALTIKVGQSATVGSLTITAKACVVRPSDQPADAAAYLEVTDSHPGAPGFSGWMLEAEPSLSMMQHPIYDLRVTGCA